MEKIIYLLKLRDTGIDDPSRETLPATLASQLETNSNVRGLRLAIQDQTVAAAAGLLQENSPPAPDAMLSVFVNTANDQADLLALLEAVASRIEGYLVSESEVMTPPTTEGQRTQGSVQFCAFRHRQDLSQDDFLDVWRNSHGVIAIETQSTFGYRQNLVIRRLTEDAQHFDAIVEEHFPLAALDSPHAFFDAVGDDSRLEKNIAKMMSSCERFIAMDSINCSHMSEFELKSLA